MRGEGGDTDFIPVHNPAAGLNPAEAYSLHLLSPNTVGILNTQYCKPFQLKKQL